MAKRPQIFDRLGVAPQGAPSNPMEGEIYINNTSNKLFFYSNSAWYEAGAGAGGLSAYSAAVAYISSPADVIYYTDNKIYKCITNTTAGESPASHQAKWRALSVEASSLDELSDVAISSVAAYDTLLNNGTNFVNVPTTNYIKNGQALFNTTGWATYVDAAASSPVDGTGGSANITLVRNTTTPLRGSADFKLSKDAANRQGQGASYDFSIDRADQAKPMSICFDYSTTTNFSYANNDLVIYIYDVTNATLIQPVPYFLDGSGKARLEFQSNAASTSYRLIFHIATTNANAWDFYFDEVKVSATPTPMTISTMEKQYDISSYLSASPGISSVVRAVAEVRKTKDGIWRMGFNISYQTSASTAHTLTISGVTFAASARQSISAGSSNIDVTTLFAGANPSASTLSIDFSIANGNVILSGDVELSSQPTWAVDYYPVQIGDNAETRVIAAKYFLNSSHSISTSSPIQFNNKVYDDSGSVTTGASWKFTAQVTGYYKVSGSISTTTGTPTFYIYKGGILDTLVSSSVSSAGLAVSFCGEIKLNAGEYIDIRPDGSYTTQLVASHFISVSRISGPANITAGEFVGAKYSSTSGTSIGSGAGQIIIDYNNKEFDTHNRVTTGGSWKFTAEVSGYYNVNAIMWLQNTAWSTGNYYRFALFKNGTQDTVFTQQVIQNGFTNNLGVAGSTDVYLLAGQYIDVRFDHNRSGGSVAVYTTESVYSKISITKVNR